VQVNLHIQKIILTFVFINMDIILLKQDSAEWNTMWETLANHPINEGLSEPRVAYNDGEQWQYMGSYRQGDKLIHDFRHRNHPKTQDVYKVTFNGNPVEAEQINKTIKVK
jgi:hypothetical protein